ncbi:hypothetical protein OIO90_003188 [Microbotryomycetes sp. JL221]|nr:hypothetical protein OIO90_003188 [Microbotryomycetes sp. JL221]
MLGLASSAGSYAFSTATSYVFRQDASTSKVSNSSLDDAAPSTGGTNSTTTTNHKVMRPTHKRTNSQLPSASPPRHHHHQHHRTSHTTTSHARRHQSSRQSPAPSSPSRSRKSSANHSNSASNTNPSSIPSSSRPHHDTCPTTPSSTKAQSTSLPKDSRDAIALVTLINETEDLYKILGLNKKAKTEDIRRAFLGRSRICHPDKLPDYPAATPAFQRLSYAYETLSKPASRRIYDLGGAGARSFDAATPKDGSAGLGDETLNGVLRSVFTEFLNGDFEMIRVFVNALNEGNPGLNLGDETVDSLEGAFRRVREVLLSGQKYMRLIRFELIRLYQIQADLRSLSYFDIVGRLRLTLALTRVTLEIPMVLDKAMRDEVVVRPRQTSTTSSTNKNNKRRKRRQSVNSSTTTTDESDATTGLSGDDDKNHEDDSASEDEDDLNSATTDATGTGAGELQRRGLLGPRVKGVLVLACKVLEKGEKWGT